MREYDQQYLDQLSANIMKQGPLTQLLACIKLHIILAQVPAEHSSHWIDSARYVFGKICPSRIFGRAILEIDQCIDITFRARTMFSKEVHDQALDYLLDSKLIEASGLAHIDALLVG